MASLNRDLLALERERNAARAAKGAIESTLSELVWYTLAAAAVYLFFFVAFAGGLSNVGNVPGFDFEPGYTAFQFVFVLLQSAAFGGVFTGFGIANSVQSFNSRAPLARRTERLNDMKERLREPVATARREPRERVLRRCRQIQGAPDHEHEQQDPFDRMGDIMEDIDILAVVDRMEFPQQRKSMLRPVLLRRAKLLISFNSSTSLRVAKRPFVSIRRTPAYMRGEDMCTN